ncbi:hypothetical protein [Thomasclavelia cocleata]|jgi:hypothetical protein|uniref:Uncharacterized protein n=1 Tax=Thomasclavelia cocleata TaxID=69824 RepID=A0A829Z7Y7_9FIRM|nr:hypothetical protein [Thomasclavelia cocleata]MCI9130560.1 hypothetical protein [Thomasclavelia cocleata]MCI9630219.1 hypothetical protein [Thomasclavelia cocleata]GFI40640.1 hypothetical protein IMSAGC017_00675 [Thomasclavelia cocleata]
MNEKILKMGKDEKEGNDRKRMINTIMNILNIVDNNDLEYIYNIVISRLLRVESDFDKGYILALLQSNKINQ